MYLKLKIKHRDSIEWMFVISSIMAVIAPGVMLGELSIVLFLALIMLKVLVNKKFIFSSYFIFEALFIAYILFQYLFIGVFSSQAHVTFVKNLMISLAFNIGVFLFVRMYGYVKAILNYCVGISIGFLIVILLNSKSIIQGGLELADYRNFFILKIGGVSSVYLGWIAAVGFVLVYFLYLEEKNRFRLVESVFLALTVVLTGRRKVLLFSAAAIIGGTYFRHSQTSIRKKFKWILGTVVMVLIVYFCLTQIPVLNVFLGKRLTDALKFIFDNSIAVTDSSIRTRATLITRAEGLWRENKVWGYGFGTFLLLNNDIGYYSHSNYWELLVSNGVIGLILYYSKYVCLLLMCLRESKKHANWRYKYLFVMIIVFMILEYWQITFMYRHLTVFLVFTLGIVTQKEDKNKNITNL